MHPDSVTNPKSVNEYLYSHVQSSIMVVKGVFPLWESREREREREKERALTLITLQTNPAARQTGDRKLLHKVALFFP